MSSKSRVSAGRHIPCEVDLKVAIDEAGYEGYDFILPHIAHPRCCMQPDKLPDDLSPMSRADLLLTSPEWSRLVVGTISPWIDVDADNDKLRRLSVQALREELSYYSYLCLPAITVQLKRACQPNLAKIINEFVEPHGGPMVWVEVPLCSVPATHALLPNGHPEVVVNGGNDSNHDSGVDCGISSPPTANSASCSSKNQCCADGEELDTWHWFRNFRSACDNKSRLALALRITTDLPEESTKLKRWLGEPVRAFFIDTRQFISNDKGFPVLTKAHQHFIKQLYAQNSQAILTGPVLHASKFSPKKVLASVDTTAESGDQSKQCLYFSYLNHLYKNKPVDSINEFASGYEDCLQIPLQPLGDNLESQIYETFEKDPIKYADYKKATAQAIAEVVKSGQGGGGSGGDDVQMVIMVLGAGRGPLVSATLEALSAMSAKARVFAVEKNPNAIITLKYLQTTKWQNKVTVVHSDMRDFRPKDEDKADIVVSELLGSFGDNELSPECLDGALHLMKPNCISIPQSYTSYLAPIHSPKLYQTVRQQTRETNHVTPFESSYVVRVHNHFLPSPVQELFTFSHPNFALTSNDRFKELTFVASECCDLAGLVGYFKADLFTATVLSIEPSTHTPGLFSWFPIYFPFKEQVFVRKGQEIQVLFWRCSNARHVWYEWCLKKPVQTPIMNVGGRSSFIRKI